MSCIYVEQFSAYLDGIFEPLLNALSDPSDAVSCSKKPTKLHYLFTCNLRLWYNCVTLCLANITLLYAWFL